MNRLLQSCSIALVLLTASTFAQEPAGSQPAAPAAPASAPADRTPIKARVIEIKGDVKWAPLESQEWQPLKLGDELAEQTKILTGIRSSVKLQLGDEEPYSCMLVDSVGKTVLSEAYKTSDTKRIRVGVSQGRVRAGVAEGGLKSDFTVDSPVATLSKRGTWGFSLYYERATDQFEIGLTDRGLVEAINKLTAERRNVQPGQLVTEAMRRWLDQSALFRNVALADAAGQSDLELAYNRISNDGIGVIGPGSGRSVVLDLTNVTSQTQFANLLQQSLAAAPPLDLGPNQARLRSEGFFGTGRGDQLISVIIDAGSDLAKDGAARPGTIRIRRDAAESWLKSRGKR
ncbi:MAG: hypothetical protein IT450_10560 [Phycisphaerales bacterium]|nr:hypothetical protein [Phycisphaerales bacterium]